MNRLTTTSTGSRHILYAVLVFMTMSCWGGATTPRPLSVAIRASQNPVPLVSNPQGLSFSVPVVVSNNDLRALFVVGCGPAAERNIAGQWTTVFSPVCMQEQIWKVSAGDSTIIPVMLYGYTADGMLPRIDALKAQAGTYRLIFNVDTQDSGDGPTSPSQVQKVASAPFNLTN